MNIPSDSFLLSKKIQIKYRICLKDCTGEKNEKEYDFEIVLSISEGVVEYHNCFFLKKYCVNLYKNSI